MNLLATAIKTDAESTPKLIKKYDINMSPPPKDVIKKNAPAPSDIKKRNMHSHIVASHFPVNPPGVLLFSTNVITMLKSNIIAPIKTIA